LGIISQKLENQIIGEIQKLMLAGVSVRFSQKYRTKTLIDACKTCAGRYAGASSTTPPTTGSAMILYPPLDNL
jgi:hypothetical protein